jgi:hypothetical protein
LLEVHGSKVVGTRGQGESTGMVICPRRVEVRCSAIWD